MSLSLYTIFISRSTEVENNFENVKYFKSENICYKFVINKI